MDVAAKRQQSPSVKSPSNASMSPSSGSDYSACQGCLHEKLAMRQLSPTRSLPESYSPGLDNLLHISEESLLNDNKEDNHVPTVKAANELNDNVGKFGNISCNSSISAPSAPESEVSFLSTSNDENNLEKKIECETKLFSQPDLSAETKNVTHASSEPNSTNNVLSENSVNKFNVTRQSESDMYIPSSPTIETLTQCPASTVQQIANIHSQINSSSGLVLNQPLFSTPHKSNVLSASYPSPGFPVLALQPQMPPIVHPSSAEIYNPRYVNPMSCYQQVGIHQNPAYPSNPVGTNVLQSTPDLSEYSMYQPMTGTCHVPNSGAWPTSNSTCIASNILPAQSIASNISSEIVDSGIHYVDGISMLPVNSSSVESSVNKAKTSQSGVKNTDGQMTPLYGQPAWWGDSDTPEISDKMKMTKSVESDTEQSSINTPPSIPVATAFTIDFDIPNGSTQNKKFAIKDSLKKFAPPKPNNEEIRGHRRSSSQNIIVEDETFPKEEIRKAAKSGAPKAGHKLSSNINKATKPHQSHPTADHKLEKPNKRSEASSKVATNVSSDKAQDKYLDSAPMSQSYPIPTQVNESAAFLIEKMLNPDSVKQNMIQKTKGYSEDRIRRKTVILSPKDESVIDRRKTVILSPKEEFPDNLSETGTYTLDLDKPDAEAEAARNNIDKVFGLKNGEKSTSSKQIVKEKCDLVATSVQKNVSEGSRPPVAPPRLRNKVEKESVDSLPTHKSPVDAPRHRRKLPTPPVDQSPLDIRTAFSPKLNGTANLTEIKGPNNHHNGDIPYDTKKILKDTENVVTAMQARIKKNKAFGHSSPMLAHLGASSSSDSDLDASSASLASDSALFNRQKKFISPSSRRLYTSDDGLRNHSSDSRRQSFSNRPQSAGVQSFRIERPNSVQSNSSESSDSSRKKKPPPNDLSLKVNRAFELRRARAEDDHTTATKTQSKTQLKTRPGSAGSAGSSRSIQPSASSSRLSTENFNRSDGGRFSLRVKSALSSKPKGPTKKAKLAAWTRRKAYNPMKAAAQGKKKSCPRMDESFYTDDETSSPFPSNVSETNDISPTSRHVSHRLEALDMLVISSIHQLSCRLRNKSQEILSKAKDNSLEKKEKSKLQEVINQLNLEDSPVGNSTQELSSILKNLKRIELGLDVLNKASCLEEQPNKDDEYY
ncbi:hypothetical protein GQR58_016308 [Nymphon striatum]|nr:hypothetical protein GQR58_016308 [Nymphon striatum]